VQRQVSEKARHRDNRLFGSVKVSIPTLVTAPAPVDYTLNIPSAPAFTNEQFWFEMRKSTGGSRNILDLSKLGQIVEGSVFGTPYDCSDPSHMYGGVKFFEIDPEDITREKNITINYLGKDFFPSTIKFAPNNGSWRIQLKGEPADGTDELSKYGHRGDFVHKILIFEKITPDYYVLSLLDDMRLDDIKALSRVWARNGRGTASKAYGML
jgi:hypothetical protein